MTKKLFLVSSLFICTQVKAMKKPSILDLRQQYQIQLTYIEFIKNAVSTIQEGIKSISTYAQQLEEYNKGVEPAKHTPVAQELTSFVATLNIHFEELQKTLQFEEQISKKLENTLSSITVEGASLYSLVTAKTSPGILYILAFESLPQNVQQTAFDALKEAIDQLKLLESRANKYKDLITKKVDKFQNYYEEKLNKAKDPQETIKLLKQYLDEYGEEQAILTQSPVEFSSAQSSSKVDLHAYENIDSTWSKLRALQNDITKLSTYLSRTHPNASHQYILILRQLLNSLSTHITNFDGVFHAEYKRLPLPGTPLSHADPTPLASRINNLLQEITMAYHTARNVFETITTCLQEFDAAMQKTDSQQQQRALEKVKAAIGQLHLHDLSTGRRLNLLPAQQDLFRDTESSLSSSQPLPATPPLPTAPLHPVPAELSHTPSKLSEIDKELNELKDLQRDYLMVHNSIENELLNNIRQEKALLSSTANQRIRIQPFKNTLENALDDLFNYIVSKRGSVWDGATVTISGKPVHLAKLDENTFKKVSDKKKVLDILRAQTFRLEENILKPARDVLQFIKTTREKLSKAQNETDLKRINVPFEYTLLDEKYTIPATPMTSPGQQGTAPVPSSLAPSHPVAHQEEPHREFETLKDLNKQLEEKLITLQNDTLYNFEQRLERESIKNSRLSPDKNRDYAGVLIDITQQVRELIHIYLHHRLERIKVVSFLNFLGKKPTLLRLVGREDFLQQPQEAQKRILEGLVQQNTFIQQALAELNKVYARLQEIYPALLSASNDDDAYQTLYNYFPFQIPNKDSSSPTEYTFIEFPDFLVPQPVQHQSPGTVPFTPPFDNELARLLGQLQEKLDALKSDLR